MKYICRICKKVFYREPSRLRAGTCNKICGNISRSKKLIGRKRPDFIKIKISQGCKKNGIGKWMKGRKNPQFAEASHKRKGILHPCWKGGFIKRDKYILVHQPHHPLARQNHYVLEHRLIVEKYLNRYLSPQEVIHHINHNPLDNRIENLKLFATNKEHKKYETTRKNIWEFIR